MSHEQQHLAQWEQAYDMLAVPVSLASEDGRILKANEPWCSLFGVDDKSFPLESINTFLDEDYHSENDSAVRLIVSSRKQHTAEYWFTLSDGTHSLLEVSSSPHINGKGQVDGVISIYHDVSSFNWALEELKKTIAKTVEREQHESISLTQLTHRLRYTMSAIGAGAKLLEASGLSEEQNAWVSTVRCNVREMQNQIDILLKMSHLYSDNRAVGLQEIDIVDIAKDVAFEMKPLADEKCLNMVVDLDPAVPISLYGEKDNIKQLMKLLVDNSIRFTEEGVVKISLKHVKYTDRLSFIKVQVSDTGCGIHPFDVDSIFEAYYSGKNGKGGYGLGLSYARALCAAMGCQLKVNSELFHGSTFHCVLPLSNNNYPQ